MYAKQSDDEGKEMIDNIARASNVAGIEYKEIEPMSSIPSSEITNAGLENKELLTPTLFSPGIPSASPPIFDPSESST